MGVMGKDVVRIDGRVISLARARALGLVDADGTPKVSTIPGLRGKKTAIGPRAARRQRNLPDPDESVEEVLALKSDTQPRRQKPQPLRPKNVKGGVEVTDPAILAAVAEKEGKPRASRIEDPNDARREAFVEESIAAHEALAVNQPAVTEKDFKVE